MPAMEERLGCRFEALYASYDSDDGYLTVNLDVLVDTGDLEDDVSIVFSAYNAAGELIATDVEHLFADDFFGMDSRRAWFECREEPVRIKVYPRRS
jgi:hypothetical protein